jgi:hypothetical protein
MWSVPLHRALYSRYTYLLPLQYAMGLGSQCRLSLNAYLSESCTVRRVLRSYRQATVCAARVLRCTYVIIDYMPCTWARAVRGAPPRPPPGMRIGTANRTAFRSLAFRSAAPLARPDLYQQKWLKKAFYEGSCLVWTVHLVHLTNKGVNKRSDRSPSPTGTVSIAHKRFPVYCN